MSAMIISCRELETGGRLGRIRPAAGTIFPRRASLFLTRSLYRVAPEVRVGTVDARAPEVGLRVGCNRSRCGEMALTIRTDLGDMKLELFCERAPRSCENFLALCASDYYNGCLFHRNIKGFIVQTGDPTGTSKGGCSIWGRKYEDEISEHLKHNVRGVVSMANSGPNSNGSQFFFTYGKQPQLDMKYTVFGKVIDGLETLDELEKLPVNEKTFRPLTDVRIKDIVIHANPFAL